VPQPEVLNRQLVVYDLADKLLDLVGCDFGIGKREGSGVLHFAELDDSLDGHELMVLQVQVF